MSVAQHERRERPAAAIGTQACGRRARRTVEGHAPAGQYGLARVCLCVRCFCTVQLPECVCVCARACGHSHMGITI